MLYMDSGERSDLTHFDQESLRVIFKDADPGIVGAIHNSGKCCFPWCHSRAEKHCAYREA